ncbi:zinc finger CCHC domain-containing protein 8 homolog [Bombus vosnesenskii]|uniref:Zinc finger CCHC domain-containing protein 8 homolog n=1 Tax=Bombus vosnesenskii TaxID=207650 RepID=A0A6J3KM41_9HYME|nr:zinc finger CCHC domain-containing protein 8 homolog [Bombus vosnesenskii]
MNSTITINDTDEEVIDLDSSQDINITDNDQSECSIEKDSLPNNNADKMNVTNNYMDNNKNASTMETCDSESSSTPLLKVMFRDENIAWQYSKRIKVFLEELVSSKIKCQENDNGLTLEVWDNDTDSTSQSIDITTGSDDSQDIICDTLFTVDKQPRPGDEFDVPSYSRKYILCDNVFDDTKLKSSKYPEGNSQRFMCFNCSGNHNLRDCTEPRNYTAIEANRKNFNMKGNSKGVRYHLENNHRFDHIIPGQLSNNLRNALGLRSNELPRHIYRMRKLGYPPGWLEEARLQHSGLSLFNSDGIAEEDPNDEPGHIVEERDRDQYDIKKIYDFPGFNVPAPPGTWDEDGKYSVSTMLTFHSKQRMLSNLKGRMADDGYKRKKLKVFSNTSKDSPVPEPTEMEIEDVEDSPVECVPTNGLFIPPLPLDDPVKPPEPLLPQESCAKPSEPLLSKSTTISEDSDYHSQELQFSEALEDTTSPSLRANSPSLSELENMKKQLLVELQKSNSDISSKSNSSNSVSKSDMPPPSNEITPELNRIRQNGINTSHGSVKSIDFGTPVLQSTSPYNKLPPSEKFSKNICNLINFENLPDSTGKYEQMTGVLQKVRHTLAKLHQE